MIYKKGKKAFLDAADVSWPAVKGDNIELILFTGSYFEVTAREEAAQFRRNALAKYRKRSEIEYLEDRERILGG